MKKFLKIAKEDNVVIALTDLPKESKITLDDREVTLAEDIAKGHKLSIEKIESGKDIMKYGLSIGSAKEDIEEGRWIHTHNTKTNLSDVIDYSYTPNFKEVSVDISEKQVEVYERKNGDVGIRNELWIVPTVGCVNGIAKIMMKEFLDGLESLDIDGVNILRHDYGCSQLGDDHENTKKILQNAVKHPNAGGVLVLGLGCENNQMDAFRETLGEYDEDRVRFLISQEVEDEIEVGKELLGELYTRMVEDKRTTTSIGRLKFGLECGGSDGFSGVTANPMLGVFSDYVTKYGGTSVLTEVPEMFGAERLLMDRCQSKEVYDKTVRMINSFKEYFKKNDQEIYENPSPGNKKGGITTLEDKSLGCTEKSGRSKVMDVLDYGEVLTVQGLNLINAPGNDLVATSALAAAGCHMVLFTTGRGNPYGGFVPTMKISTNTDLANRKKRWIDFDAGRLISENLDMTELTEEFINEVIEVANGKKSKNELNDFRELAIFKSGVTL